MPTGLKRKDIKRKETGNIGSVHIAADSIALMNYRFTCIKSPGRFLIILGIFLMTQFQAIHAQIVINEVSNKNSGQVADEDSELEDWIEIFNPSSSALNLKDYYLSDDTGIPEKWKFPDYYMASGDHLLVFASGKDRYPLAGHHWESAIYPDLQFNYIVPVSSTPSNWKDKNFNPSGWNTGQAGFGYADGDDRSVVPDGTRSAYIRKSFMVPESFSFTEAVLHVDYDDGFVAYLNGIEIARMNIDGIPSWNSTASAGHEALMYNGGAPEQFNLDTELVRSILVAGENIFAIQVHNLENSSDLTLIPYLSFFVPDAVHAFDPPPPGIFPGNIRFFHTNFKIDSKGETLLLYNKQTGNKDSVEVNNLSYGWSMGRTTDGAATWSIFTEPTPLYANTTKAYSIQREPDPVFSIPEGFYEGQQSVTLSSTSESSEIRYTIDGTEPTVSSTLFSGTPLQVASTRVIRACSFSKGDKLPSRSIANTYFINKGTHSLPVISLITSNDNLYGNTGIFDNWYQEWERPAYMEYFDADKKKQFEQPSGIQVDGGAGGSRSHPQHSFRFEFSNNLYGDWDVDYPLIPGRPERNDYKSVYLRNGSNQYLTFQFKDAMETRLTGKPTLNYYSECTPVVVYINGSYFGLYEMREKLNDEYFEENYGATIDSTFHLLSLSYYYGSVLRALNGSVDSFMNDYNRFMELSPSSPDYLEKAGKILDLDYYTDYIIAQTWIADTDWPYNNIKIVKGDFTAYRWRFILQDLEWALNPNGWTNSSFDHINYMLNYDQGNIYLRFWRELIKNPEYKRTFINRMADIMNTAYLPDSTQAIAQEIYDDSFGEMRSEYVRWGGGESSANSNMANYANNLATFKYELNRRSSFVRTHTVSNFGLASKYDINLQVDPEGAGTIRINSIQPLVYPWTGVYFGGVPVKMEAVPSGNYEFDSWLPNTFIKDVKNPVIEADVRSSAYLFKAKFRKRADQQAITISEVNYASSEIFPTTDWIELYNFGESTVDLTGWYFRDKDETHRFDIPGSFTLAPQERLVVTSRLPVFKIIYPGVENVTGSFDFGLGSDSDSVLLYNAEGRLIASLGYSSMSPWPTGPLTAGTSLELKDPWLELSSPGNWFGGCIGGSPGTQYVPCTTGIAEKGSVPDAVKLYPNPATDRIMFTLPGSEPGETVTWEVLDLTGMCRISGAYRNSAARATEISLSELPAGMYFLRIIRQDKIYNTTFIKAE